MVKSDDKLKSVWVVSFADSRMVRPKVRLRKQAERFGFPKEHIIIWDERDLSQEFLTAMKEHLELGKRGFGYWCWKPEVILRVLERVPDGDIVFYSDVGNHLNRYGKKRFYDYIEIVNERGALGFQSRSLTSDEEPDPRTHINTISQYTKGDILDFFHVRDLSEIIKAAQVLGGVLFFKKSNDTVAFVKKWGEIFYEHFSLADDSPSTSFNMPDFVANRHDQALLSIMWLLHHYPTVSSCEVELLKRHLPPQIIAGPEWGGSWFWQNRRFPIHARRDKGDRLAFFRKLYWYFRNGKFICDIRARVKYFFSGDHSRRS